MSLIKLIKAGYNKVSAKTLAFLLIGYSMLFGRTALAAYDFNNAVTKGKTLTDLNKNIETYSNTTFNMIKTVGVLVGLVLVFVGVMRLKKSQDQNSGVSPMQGLILIVIGGLCAVLPWLLLTSASTAVT